MTEVIPNLYVGNGDDFAALVHRLTSHLSDNSWSILSAAKEPWHRAALGYRGRAADAAHPEYLIARRKILGRAENVDHLILNLIDVDDPAYIRKELVDAAIRFIGDELAKGRKVLVHCNQGESRAPSLAFLYLRDAEHPLVRGAAPDVGAAMNKFRAAYPTWKPKGGMMGHINANYQYLQNGAA